MAADPLASMRCWAVTVELGGREFDIPALPAVDWWPVVVNADPAAILDMLKSSEADAFELDSMLLDGQVTGADLGRMLADVVEEIAGRPLQAAFVLATVATQRWDVIGGQVAQAGFRWDVQPLGAALDLIYSLIMGGLEEESRAKFLDLMDRDTLTGRKKPSERVMREFETMAGPRPAPAPLPGKATAGPSGSPPPRTPPPPRQPRQGARSGAPRKQP